MAKVCPNCQQTNPSAAKFCMYCNAPLVDMSVLTEADKLRKELADAKTIKEFNYKENERLKEVLEKKLVEQKGAEQKCSQLEKDVGQLQEQLDASIPAINAQEKKIKKLESNVPALKNRSRKSNFFIAAVILVGLYVISVMSMDSDYEDLEADEAEIACLQDSLASRQEQLASLQEIYELKRDSLQAMKQSWQLKSMVEYSGPASFMASYCNDDIFWITFYYADGRTSREAWWFGIERDIEQ